MVNKSQTLILINSIKCYFYCNQITNITFHKTKEREVMKVHVHKKYYNKPILYVFDKSAGHRGSCYLVYNALL